MARKNEYGDLRTYFPTIPKQVIPAPATSHDIDTVRHVQHYQKARAFTPVKIKEEELSEADEDDERRYRIEEEEQIKEADSTTESEGEKIVVTQPVRTPMHAFHRAHAKATKYFDEFMYALNNLAQTMQPQITDGPVIDVPQNIVRGEYTLYSPDWMVFHKHNYSHLWTEQFAATWSAGTLRLGYRWGHDGSPVGLEFAITGIDHEFRTVVDLDGREAGQVYELGTHTELGFVRGPYMGLKIAKAYLGWEVVAGECRFVFFHGILDRTEEDMYKWGARMTERNMYPYYNAPFTPTLPQAQVRY
ncbi:hypothetical protein PtrSN002B_003502 [Pyrenophora tritici-repentis]|nr:hypothetical protein Alg215_05009 [Pyrenophora tritici-repentis]KAI1554935.1 hypothetical protein PtrSN002B_003502 [Pyrenophora tritici-repentis]KAI1592485.1 hypothetical protein PtrEW13061_003741 [Pyrenophora tritici-repentis]PZC96016.1 hypothetical protein A1F95_05623 [Pyrenophora tritici-repentis]PZD27479.1 hypothetical protein A1F96_06699 [Pyrenophora tritici-repentis]